LAYKKLKIRYGKILQHFMPFTGVPLPGMLPNQLYFRAVLPAGRSQGGCLYRVGGALDELGLDTGKDQYMAQHPGPGELPDLITFLKTGTR
jgi:hypothetical protein